MQSICVLWVSITMGTKVRVSCRSVAVGSWGKVRAADEENRYECPREFKQPCERIDLTQGGFKAAIKTIARASEGFRQHKGKCGTYQEMGNKRARGSRQERWGGRQGEVKS